ncbi:MAG TPA: nucleoside-diphosphate sugar epimerase/dehydratase [Terriglobales bacterium]|nr:nucleoside-diphosphate sugar epimerase/dehydratase [Terriglobales bacterium]
MSAGAMENISNALKVEPESNGFLRYRAALIFASQAVLIVLTYYASFLLRLDADLDAANRALFWKTLPFVLLIKLVLAYQCGLMHGWWRYVGISDLLDISKASVLSSSLIFCLVEGVLNVPGYPRSVVVIDLFLTIMVLGGARFAVRAYTERARSYGAQRNTLVVGAGEAGSAIVRELKQNSSLNYNPVGFVDDDLSKKGVKIHGVRVLGSTDALHELILEHQVSCVMIAIPRAKGRLVETIIAKCRECKVDFKILPPIGDWIAKPVSLSQVRQLRVEDLLERAPVALDLDQIRGRITDKVLLVTGAGGSIGSELTRQAAALGPRRLVLLDRSENDLFKLGHELSRKFPSLDYIPVVGDIQDVTLLREVFATHRPHSVFHAAAYKHVPMMERNCFQAITNNIFGTYNVALLARQYRVEDFVLISSDKAVNPTNIMGVTKRVAELIMQGLQDNENGTRFMAVRFGNVLGSNGSALPLFEQQIAAGGPVTVTHPDARRYFMTIPEAVQLVLQASSMGQGGEVFVLDMGEPVRILDLVRNLIRLSGLEPDRDIKIEFVGLRPGEKLFEELKLEGEDIGPTPHEKIRVLTGGKMSFEQVSAFLDELSVLVEAKNVHGLVTKLVAIVPEYWPSPEIISLGAIDRHDQALIHRQARESLNSNQESAA